jgi:hypothetical protein
LTEISEPARLDEVKKSQSEEAINQKAFAAQGRQQANSMEEKALPDPPQQLNEGYYGGVSQKTVEAAPVPASTSGVINLPPINDAPPKKQVAEDDFVEPTTCFGKCRYRFEQQDSTTRSDLPMKWFSCACQVCCASACAITLGIFGIMFIVAAGSVKEVVVPYKYPDLYKDITITEDMTGDINMWYDLPGVNLNHKKYISSVDPNVIKLLPFMGKKNCDDANSRKIALWRRVDAETRYRQAIRNASGVSHSAGDKFSEVITAISNDIFAPCGLQPLAMFTDEYALKKQGSLGAWVSQPLDESNIQIKQDNDIYKNKIVTNADGTAYQIKDKTSWKGLSWCMGFAAFR